jgi:hypothetical protein
MTQTLEQIAFLVHGKALADVRYPTTVWMTVN